MHWISTAWDQQINRADGIRIDFEKEWVHLRKSNTEPIIRVIAESDSLQGAERLANKVINTIKSL